MSKVSDFGRAGRGKFRERTGKRAGGGNENVLYRQEESEIERQKETRRKVAI